MKPINPTWYSKYNIASDFLSFFNDEQDFVDAMFVQIVMYNFGVYHDASTLRMDGPEITGYHCKRSRDQTHDRPA